MEKKLRKGRMAVLYVMSVLMMCVCISMNTYAMTGAEHPDAEISPDGKGWTIINELPAEDYSSKEASFWLEVGT